jgi:hypothetical protein
MGSSGGGTPRAPNYPTPAGLQVPYGQTAPYQPSYTSFLPSDPTAMATGLTPEMLAGINNQEAQRAAAVEAQRNALAAAAAQRPQRRPLSPLEELERVFGRGSINVGGRGNLGIGSQSGGGRGRGAGGGYGGSGGFGGGGRRA